MSEPRLRFGVSACLLGQQVRFDGGHKRDPFLTGVLSRFVDWVPVCPEEDAGFGTPRESMRLVREGDGVRLLTVRSRRDVTDAMRAAAGERAAALAALDLDGYILKKDSPSCGLWRVKVYAASGPGERVGRGLFAEALCAALPLLPVEEEGRLSDPRLRENFIERAYAYRRLRAFAASRPRAGDLVRFHTRHKLLLMAHSPAAYAALGRVVATGREAVSRLAEYGTAFMQALTTLPTRGRHANVLRHMTGYLQPLAARGARLTLASTVDDYEHGLLPLVVPVTLLAHYAREYDVRYLLDQVYLQPHPKELGLRNHA